MSFPRSQPEQLLTLLLVFATAQNIWQFIDPSKEGKLALASPAETTVQQINPEPADLAVLTVEEFRRLEFCRREPYDNTRAGRPARIIP